MESKTYNIYYDEESDFLEVFFGEPSESYAEEVEPGIFVRRDDQTDKVTSINILSYKKRADVLRSLLKKINLRLPINIELE
ncbi:MAG: DUF2283 domain-containing protein [Nanoarchaeota archaeon]